MKTLPIILACTLALKIMLHVVLDFRKKNAESLAFYGRGHWYDLGRYFLLYKYEETEKANFTKVLVNMLCLVNVCMITVFLVSTLVDQI